MDKGDIFGEKIQCRRLPPGKEYHVFLSYRDIDEDKEWVRVLSEKLKTEYSLICCDHSVDFQPGKTIVENIKHAVTSSVKTLLILSKEYLSSYWCNYEVDFTHLMSMETRQKLIIPVLKEDCDIPDHIKSLTYIDARGDMELWIPRLVAAIESQDDVNNSAIVPNKPENKFCNLDVVYEKSSRFRCCGRSSLKSPYLPAALDKTVFNLNANRYNKVLKIISESTFYRHQLLCLPWWLSITVFVVVLYSGVNTLIDNIYGLKSIYGNYKTTEQNITAQEMVRSSDIAGGIAGAVLGLLLTLCMLIWPLGCCRYFLKKRKRIKNILVAVNRKLMSNNLLVGLNIPNWSANIKVVFVYYNYQACMDYVESVLRCTNSYCQKKKRTTTETINETGCKYRSRLEDDRELPTVKELRNGFVREISSNHDDDELIIPLLPDDEIELEDADGKILRRIAKNILINLSADFVQDFIDENLVDCESKRHTTRAICLCQYAEQKNKIHRKTPNLIV